MEDFPVGKRQFQRDGKGLLHRQRLRKSLIWLIGIDSRLDNVTVEGRTDWLAACPKLQSEIFKPAPKAPATPEGERGMSGHNQL